MLLAIVLLVAGLALGGVLVALAQHIRAPRRAQGAEPWRTIAVPIVNGSVPYAALSVAARLSRSMQGNVVVLAIVQIPRTMNIDAGSPPGLEEALARLDAAERLVRKLGAQVHGEVVRVRELGDLAGRACEETGAQAVVVEAGGKSRGDGELVRTLVDRSAARHVDVILTHATSDSGAEGAATPRRPPASLGATPLR